MRPLSLSLGASILFLGAVWAQNSGESGNMRQVPVGQTFKQFEYPDYEDGKLKARLFATEATGITLNRAEAKNVRIEIYDNGVLTTTITSPDADLYVNEEKMRTKNTVKIERADLTATSQNCDFNKKAKKYVLRTNVRVLLKHFDIGTTPANDAATTPASDHAPGSSTETNSAPTSPSSTDTK